MVKVVYFSHQCYIIIVSLQWVSILLHHLLWSQYPVLLDKQYFAYLCRIMLTILLGLQFNVLGLILHQKGKLATDVFFLLSGDLRCSL